MIISVTELQTYPEFSGLNADQLQIKLNAIEQLIRKYTNNNFQNRYIRFLASSSFDENGYYLNAVSPFLVDGDTVQISRSEVNDGLYVVTMLNDKTKVDKSLFAVEKNLVTKIEYPDDIKAGVINLLKWELNNREKVGIKQETLSRHSVTYYDQDANNQVMGYPVSLLGFLEPYKKARF